MSYEPHAVLQNMIQYKLTALLINKKIFFAKQIDKCLLIYNKILKYVTTIDLKNLKDILIEDKFSLVLKFFPIYNKQNIKLKLLSRSQKNIFVDNILPTSMGQHRFDKSLSLIMFKLIRDKKSFFNFLVNKYIQKLSQSNTIYYKDIYDLLKKKLDVENNKKYLTVLIFIFSEEGRLSKIFNSFYFDFSRVLAYYRTLEEKVLVVRKNNTLKYFYLLNKNTCPGKTGRKVPTAQLGSTSQDLTSDGVSPRGRARFKNHGDVNLIKDKKVFPRGGKDICSKAHYERLLFNVNIVGYFGIRDPKVLEVNKEHFMLYKKQKSDSIMSHMLNDIVQMEGDSSSNFLNVTINLNKAKKIYYLEFASTYEKYIFKTIVYNHLLISIPHHTVGSDLKLNVNVITWNVAGIDVPEDLTALFNTNSLEGVDIYTIGVQECSIWKTKDWQKHLKTLMSYYGYEDVSSIDMCQMFIIVFIKTQWKPFIDNVSSSHKPMGFAKIIGNKGGVAVGFRLFGYQMTFVNCHLAPKPYKVLERNKMAKNLVKSLKVCEKFAEFDVVSDYLFWQGDLNYRIDFCFDETVEEIKNNNINLLLAKDQLLRQKQLNNIFNGFQEPQINFFPTYRRIKGTDEYSNKKNQSPSWCDRIMVKTERELDLHFYDSVKNVRHSDHLPVLSKFSIYLTVPSFNDAENTLTQNVLGKLMYSNISLNYDFLEGFGELDIEPKFPLKLKLCATYITNKTMAESNLVIIKSAEDLSQIIEFEDMNLNYPLQYVFDLPHARSQNIFFILKLQIQKSTYEIGYGKYSLEEIEKQNLSLLTHDYHFEISWRTRKFGSLNFTSNFKF